MNRPVDRERLQPLLGGDALAPLRQRLRRAYADAAPGSLPATLRLAGLTPPEVERLQALTGRAPRAARSIQIDLAELGQRLSAAGVASDLRAALEALDGPIVTRHQRTAEAARWAALAADAPHPGLATGLAEPRTRGLLKRLAGSDVLRAQALCTSASRVLQALPAAGWPRAQLAARLLGDAHALDDGQPVATLVLAVLRQGASDEDAESRRALWANQGVAVNELARPALALNLPAADLPADAGEPQHWSLRRLLRRPPAWAVHGCDVFVCENPNLLALAADALGAGCRPLVCTDGMPAAAQRTLLQQLGAAGATLHYHGDFDWPGITIGNRLIQQFGAHPWRFGHADYRAALSRAGVASAGLDGNPVVAGWDADLAPAMQAAARSLPEEALFDTLHTDLAA